MAEPDKPGYTTPIEIARETLRRLATQRIAPTPDNYQILYEEIAGVQAGDGEPSAAVLLTELAREIYRHHPELAGYASSLIKAIEQKNWRQCRKPLGAIAQRLRREQADMGLQTGAENLTLLRDMLANTLELATVFQLSHVPRLQAKAQSLAARVREANSTLSLRDIASGLKHLWLDIEMGVASSAEEEELLKRILLLLVENISELLDDDTWLRGQLDVVQEVIAGPFRIDALREAEKRLKEVIYKQSLAKHSLREATATLKATMSSFVARIGEAVEASATYQKKIDEYAAIIASTDDVHTLNRVFENLLADTRAAQADTHRAHSNLVAGQAQAQSAEARIRQLERELDEMSALVREDPLTKSLNRRGLDEELQREVARCERFGWGFSVAVLDIDDFKMLNDTRGHLAGDTALTHLVEVAKRSLRPFDQVARLGGEEFLIVLPRTGVDEAAEIVRRLQRALTREFFLDRNEPVLITFSAGVAEWRVGEAQQALIERADAAMYAAKQSGKNRVVVAPPAAAPQA